MVLNAPHVHLVLNHFPLFATLFGIVLLAYGSLYRSNHARVAAYIILIIAALGTIPVFMSGSASEDTVEKLQGVLGALIDTHEDAGKLSLVLILITGTLALVAWVMDIRTRKVPRILTLATLVAALLTTASFSYAAFLGGQIHHQEIRPAGASSSSTAQDPRN
jgi:hypothetical protein